ncbi:ABC transporter substrate-binding protein [Nonomuraea sp. NPDC046570]|uniref:ABC transporter substrate-binding protein n=1 Tax=Nonomuraea sp. NPDC046570 TaxID=3155255 RepID=UPI0033DA93A7
MMRIRMIVLAVCGAVVLAACGGGSSGKDSKVGGSDFKPTTSGPIEIGMLITDTRAESARNGVGIVSPHRDAAHAMFDKINAGGGIKGRKIKVVDEAIDFSAPNHDTAFEAICQRFTKDNNVQAVVYDGTIYNGSFNSCLTKAGVPILYMGGSTGSAVGDSDDLKKHPGLIAVNSVSLDRRVESIMNKAIAADHLRSGSKIGVVIEDCPYNERAYDKTLKPIADKGGIALVKAEVKCAHGYADNGPNLALIQSLALKFKSQDVDSVMFLTLYENGVLYYFAQGAHTQKWSPQYLLFHSQGGANAMTVYSADQLTNMRGFGGMPDIDVTEPPAPSAEQAKVREACLADARTAGLAVQKIAVQITVFQACDAVRLLQQGLINSGGLGGTEKLVPGIEKIGTDYISALTLGGATKFGPDRHDGMELTAVSSFDKGCKCFKYTTPAGPIE